VTTPTPAEGRTHPFWASTTPSRQVSNVELGVFAATEALLQRMAIGELTVADILTEAKISRTTFYKYFTSKGMVVSAMLRACRVELLDVSRPWTKRGKRPPEDALHETISSVAKVWARHRPVLRASSESWHSESEIGQEWVAMMDDFVDDITRQINRERKSGVAPAGADSKQIAIHLAWGGERLFYLAGFGLCGPGLESDVVDTMVAVWLAAIYKA